MSTENKIFIGGLAGHTTSESMTLHFSQFGQADCMVMMDRSTGRSRGFGFCTFLSPESMAAVLATPQVVDGKVVDCKVCMPKEAAPPPQQPRAFGQFPGLGAVGRAFPQTEERGWGGERSTEQLDVAAGAELLKAAGMHLSAAMTEAVQPAQARSEPSTHAGYGGDSNLIENKIFVGGLPAVTTDDSMQAYFSQWGPCECVVMMDKMTGRSRGFGFCTFLSASEVQSVLQVAHVIDGKPVECKLCEAKGSAPPPQVVAPPPQHFGGYGPARAALPPQQSSFPRQQDDWDQQHISAYVSPETVAPAATVAPESSRVFVGGLPQTCDDNKLREFCSRFGAVTDCKVMLDGGTGRSRGFGYVSFEDAQSVEWAIAHYAENVIDEKWIEIKRCAPKGAFAAGAGPGGGGGGGGGGALVAAPVSPVKSQQEIAQAVASVAQLLQDPSLSHLQGFLQPLLELQEAVVGKSARYRPY